MLSDILENSEKYELLTKTNHLHSNDIVNGNIIVMDFIRHNKLILYGGSAIDMALRLKGSKIYPDELMPYSDLDFYSPKNVEHAYDLVEILYKNGYIPRTIGAIHPTTMKIDIGDNNWIADISYMPMESIPTLDYDGMKLVHPDFQKIDMYRTLSFPFIGAPREEVLHRFGKILKRLDLLNQHYPIKIPKLGPQKKFKFTIANHLTSGLAAFIILKEEFIRQIPNLTKLPDEFINNFRGEKNANKLFVTATEDFMDRLIICIEDFEKSAIIMEKKEKFNPILDIIPPRIDGNLRIYEISGQSYIPKLGIVSLNFIMYDALARYFLLGEAEGLILYCLCFELIELADYYYDECKIFVEENIYPSFEVVGKSISGSYINATNYMKTDLYGSEGFIRPQNYNIIKNGKFVECPALKEYYYNQFDGRKVDP